jgi:uncharacterized membrane protein
MKPAYSLPPPTITRRPLFAAGIALGLGLGGLLDGILFRQILQWHHLLSSAGYPDDTVAGLEVNMLADGLFQAVWWAVTVAGLVLLWRAARHPRGVWSSRLFGGAVLIGAGLFYLIEGLAAHYLLGLHHVKPGPGQGFWDAAFLLTGALLALIGLVLVLAGRRDEPDDALESGENPQAIRYNASSPRRGPSTRLPPRH